MYNHVQIISHGKVRIKSKYACVQLQHILINVQVMTSTKIASGHFPSPLLI